MREPVFPFYLVCTQSGSMAGQPIAALNHVLTGLHREISSNPVAADKIRFCLIGISSNAEMLLPLADLREIRSIPSLHGGGGISFSGGFNLLYDAIATDVVSLKAGGYRVLRPTVFFLSDGDPQDYWRPAHIRLTDPKWIGRPYIVAFGFGGVSYEVLLAVATDKAFVGDGSIGLGETLGEFINALARSMIFSATSLSDPDGLARHILPDNIPGFAALSADIDPTKAAGLDDLAECLLQLHREANMPTLREMELTQSAGEWLPGTNIRRVPLQSSTLRAVLQAEEFPSKSLLLTFVEACGVNVAADRRWEQAWNRLAKDRTPGSATPRAAHGDERAELLPSGHAFLSYVREDTDKIDQLQRRLETSGIPVWRDTRNLWPGDAWRTKIRQAITSGSVVFIACFSRNSETREKTYQNEELILAIEQFRLRRPDVPWLIPVRLDDCSIPDIDIGGGRTLASLQCADLFGERYEVEALRLTEAIARIIGK